MTKPKQRYVLLNSKTGKTVGGAELQASRVYENLTGAKLSARSYGRWGDDYTPTRVRLVLDSETKGQFDNFDIVCKWCSNPGTIELGTLKCTNPKCDNVEIT